MIHSHEEQLSCRKILVRSEAGKGDRLIFDDGNQWQLSTTPIRGEDDPPTSLKNANLAYDGLGATRDFYRDVLGRDSLDNAGLTLQAQVNFGTQFDNAFWDGTEMVFGNGDDTIFKDFTGDVDVIGHELSHGVTQFTAGLLYTDQPGALNEATSDIFGACVEQFKDNLNAGTFNWLIGEDVMADGLYGEAIRSMKNPGTAYDDPVLGKDPQAANMAQYVPGGDPHINSGIINRVFYLIATDLGTFPAAKLWYATLQKLWPTADFAAAADVCAQMARILARDDVIERQGAQTVRAAFHDVGII
ncbi:M4 family metallopeptidase [Amycolatopsis sp. lyj-23]|uniref:M4 family metallopeptidase n=1 Tax=Amycolatopsis sp. lyj-23 TaxID=2789283 RepID=UPI00397D7934